MIPHWLIQSNILERSGLVNLKDVLKYKNIPFTDYKNNNNIDYKIVDGQELPIFIDFPVVHYGSIEFVNYLLYNNYGVPGSFSFKERMNPSYYMSYYPLEWFFNNDAVFLPVGMLGSYIHHNNYKNGVFVRPDSGSKIFSGFSTDLENLQIELATLNESKYAKILSDRERVPREQLCLVAKNKPIHSEYRYFIIDGKVVAGCQYYRDGIMDIRVDCHVNANILASTVANYKYQIDKAYVVDIFLDTGERAYIGEFNSFSSSGMYACDVENIIDAINKLAIKEYEEWNN